MIHQSWYNKLAATASAPKRNKHLPLSTKPTKAAATLFSAKPAKKHRQNATPNAAQNKKPNTVGISQPGLSHKRWFSFV